MNLIYILLGFKLNLYLYMHQNILQQLNLNVKVHI